MADRLRAAGHDVFAPLTGSHFGILAEGADRLAGFILARA